MAENFPTVQALDPESTELVEFTKVMDLGDPDNPYSIKNLAPNIWPHIEKAMAARPDLLGLGEDDLHKILYKEGNVPGPLDNRLRLKFFSEYEKAWERMKPFGIGALCAGLIRQEAFTTTYVKKPEKLIWMVTPPSSYRSRIHEALDHSIRKIREILELPLSDSRGRINVKLAEVQAKIFHLLDQRVRGSVVQKVEQKTLTMHVSDKMVKGMTLEKSLEEIEHKIKQLEAKEKDSARIIEIASKPVRRVEIEAGEIETTGSPVEDAGEPAPQAQTQILHME